MYIPAETAEEHGSAHWVAAGARGERIPTLYIYVYMYVDHARVMDFFFLMALVNYIPLFSYESRFMATA